MDVVKTSQEISALFIQAVHKYNALEKIPLNVGLSHGLYHSERHLLDTIGDHPAMNVTELARTVGVTKGAVSQLVKKLENKGFISRYKSRNSDKEVFLELTRAGRDIYIKHQKTNQETIKPLIEKLKKYPDDKIEFLVSMFKWIGEYLDEAGREMKRHG